MNDYFYFDAWRLFEDEHGEFEDVYMEGAISWVPDSTVIYDQWAEVSDSPLSLADV